MKHIIVRVWADVLLVPCLALCKQLNYMTTVYIIQFVLSCELASHKPDQEDMGSPSRHPNLLIPPIHTSLQRQSNFDPLSLHTAGCETALLTVTEDRLCKRSSKQATLKSVKPAESMSQWSECSAVSLKGHRASALSLLMHRGWCPSEGRCCCVKCPPCPPGWELGSWQSPISRIPGLSTFRPRCFYNKCSLLEVE